MSKFYKLVSLLVLLSFVLTACAPAGNQNTGGEEPMEAPTEAPMEEPTEAPMAEPTDTTEPMMMGIPVAALDGIQIEFWHPWSGGVGEALQGLVDEFNSTNEYGITVVPLDQGGYGDIFNNMNAAINTGELPDLVVGYNNQYLSWDAAGGIIVDLNQYMDDPDVGYSAEEQADFYQTFFEQDVIGGRRLGLPAQRSGQYFFYNVTWAKELGFDSAPTTPQEFYDQACAAAAANGDGTGGWFIYTDASGIASWIWAFGGQIENPDGGYYFDTPEAQAAFEFLNKLYADGCAWKPENSYPNPEFATRQGLFYTSSVAGYPYQVSAMEDAGNTDEWTMIPYPSVTGDPVVNLYGPSIAMVSSTPEEQLASWLFLKFWLDGQTQATWIGSSAYFPTRASAEADLSQYAADNPIWAHALSFRDFGKVEPRFESWSSVRYSVGDAAALLFQEGFDPSTIPQILADLQATADEAYAETQP